MENASRGGWEEGFNSIRPNPINVYGSTIIYHRRQLDLTAIRSYSIWSYCCCCYSMLACLVRCSREEKRWDEMRQLRWDVVFILVGSRLDYRRKSEECGEPRDVLHETVVLRSLLLLISTSQLKRNVNLDERIIRKKQEEERGREREREKATKGVCLRFAVLIEYWYSVLYLNQCI